MHKHIKHRDKTKNPQNHPIKIIKLTKSKKNFLPIIFSLILVLRMYIIFSSFSHTRYSYHFSRDRCILRIPLSRARIERISLCLKLHFSLQNNFLECVDSHTHKSSQLLAFFLFLSQSCFTHSSE